MSWLAHECSLIASTNNYDLIPFMLPSIFFIAEQATEKEYATSILPHLIPIFAMRSPHQVKEIRNHLLFATLDPTNAAATNGVIVE
jgi:hypothetical protein